MNKLIGVRWGDLSEVTKEDLLSRAFCEGVGDCIVDLTSDLSVSGTIIDNGEEKELVINDDAIIYNPEQGIILEAKTNVTFEINNVMTVSEAANVWGKTEGAIRAAIKAKKFIVGVDYRKAGGATLITREAMERVYGEKKCHKE